MYVCVCDEEQEKKNEFQTPEPKPVSGTMIYVVAREITRRTNRKSHAAQNSCLLFWGVTASSKIQQDDT